MADQSGSLNLTERLRAVLDRLATGLVERDVAVRLSLLAALTGEHLLLVGPPGTAKSLIARRLNGAVTSSTYFERLLTRFTVPEELFGPLSIKALEEDRYERLTHAYLPQASIAFLDEIFKANSAILNALLTLLNEREFDNGTRRVKTPLVTVIGASNELPEDEELDALFDRFLLRLHVGPVSSDGFRALLDLRGHAQPDIAAKLRLSPEDLVEVQTLADEVEVPADVIALLCKLREWCTAEQIEVSDRRWRKVVKMLQTSALTNGRYCVSIWDCWLLQHCLWSVPEDREKIFNWYAERVGAAEMMNPERLTRVVVQWEAQLRKDQQSRSQAQDGDGRLLYLRPDGSTTTSEQGEIPAIRGQDPLYLAPTGAGKKDGYYVGDISDRANGGQGYSLSELDESIFVLISGDWQKFVRWVDRAAYLANPNNRLIKVGQLPPKIEPTRYKAIYTAGCIDQLTQVRTEVATYQAQLRAHIAALETELYRHLWVTDDFVGPAAASLRATGEIVETLLVRLTRVITEFSLLPGELDPVVLENPRQQNPRQRERKS